MEMAINTRPRYTILRIAFLLLLASCSKSLGDEGKRELSLIAYADLSAPEGEIARKQIAAFAEKSGIALVTEFLSGEAYHQKLAALAAGNNLPEVMMLWPGGRSSALIDNGLVENLGPFIERDGLRDYYNQNSLQPQVTVENQQGIYELPIGLTATSVLFVNTKILADHRLGLPQTYEELKTAAATLQEAGIRPLLISAKDGWVMNSVLIGTLISRFGGPRWVSETVFEKRHKFTDPEFIQALSILQDMFRSGLIPQDSLQIEYGSAAGVFANEQAAFYLDGAWKTQALYEVLSPEQQENTEMIVLPSFAGEVYPNSTTIIASSGFGMKKGLSKEKQEMAWSLIKDYSGKEAAINRFKKGGFVGAYNLDIESLDVPKFLKKPVEIVGKHQAAEVVDNFLTGKANDILNNGMQLLALGQKTPEQVAQEIQATFEKQYK